MSKFTYTGKPFPRTDFFYDFFEGKPHLKPAYQYIEEHGTVIGDNVKRVFAKHIEREHKRLVESKYRKMILFLEENDFIVKGEKSYRLTNTGSHYISDFSKNGYSCSFEIFNILKNLQKLQKYSGKKPADYCKHVKHFRLLGEVEADNQDFIGKSDVYNIYVNKAKDKGLIEIIMP